MDAKLTLKLDQDIIEQAKNYAKMKNTSLSQLIESYLGMLVEPRPIHEVTPFVKSLSGIVDLPENFDSKEAYKNTYKTNIRNNMTNVFVDTDVCIDLLSGRQPFAKPAEILFSLADLGKIKVYVSSLTFSNIDYVLRSQYSSNQSRLTLLKFKTLVHVLSVDSKTIDLAIASDFIDFEDAIQYCCALENYLTIIVTRNLKDFKKANIQVVNPETFIALDI